MTMERGRAVQDERRVQQQPEQALPPPEQLDAALERQRSAEAPELAEAQGLWQVRPVPERPVTALQSVRGQQVLGQAQVSAQQRALPPASDPAD
jgi:hypothetical protein